MTNLPSPQRAGEEYHVGCQVAGSDPPPAISWQLLDPSGTVNHIEIFNNIQIQRIALHTTEALGACFK
jgi:hypothetical protein